MQEQRPIVTRRYEDETRRYAEMDVDAFVELYESLVAELGEAFSNDNIPEDLWRQRALKIVKHLRLALKLVS